jgi:DNA-binding transcriptional LysR family regulator
MNSSQISIELRHLRYFLAVSDELHFRRAAERLHIAQPPLSHAIRRLEAELGVRLFERTSRAVTPTEAGRVFADEARKVLQSVDRAIAEARRTGAPDSRWRIGCVPHLSIELVLDFLAELRAHAPDSRLDLTQLLAVEQVSRLRSGELDVGIFPGVDDIPDLQTTPVFAAEPLAVILPVGHRLAANRTLGPEDLHRETLVLYPRAANPALHRRLLELIDAAGYRFRRVHEARGVTPRDIVLAVAGGHGVGLGPVRPAEAEPIRASIVRRDLDPPISTPETVVAWHANPPHHRQEAVAAIRDIACRITRLRYIDATDSGYVELPDR